MHHESSASRSRRRSRVGLIAALVLAALLGPPTKAQQSPGRTETILDDFADGDLIASPGLPWTVIADDVLGGGSWAELTLAEDDVGKRRSLLLDGALGEPAPGLPIRYVGAWAALGERGRSRDLTAYDRVILRTRSPRPLFLGMRRAGSTVGYAVPLRNGEGWLEQAVELSDLAALAPPGVEPTPWSSHDATWIGIYAAGTESGEVRFEIDRVALAGPAGASRASEERGGQGTGSGSARVTKLTDTSRLADLDWTVLAEDPEGDGLRTGLPDATELATATGHDGFRWFRIRLASAPPGRWLGINVVLDVDGDPSNGGAWWGTNDRFRFDRLLTAYLTRVRLDGERHAWMGSLGVSDSANALQSSMDAITDEVLVAIDPTTPAYYVGARAEALGADGGSGDVVRVLATVGSSMINNDDVPGEGAVLLPTDAANDR